MQNLDQEQTAFVTSIDPSTPYYSLSGGLMHRLAKAVNTDPARASDDQRDLVTGLASALTVCGDGRRKVTITLATAQYLAAHYPAAGSKPVDSAAAQTDKTTESKKKS